MNLAYLPGLDQQKTNRKHKAKRGTPKQAILSVLSYKRIVLTCAHFMGSKPLFKAAGGILVRFNAILMLKTGFFTKINIG